MIRHTIATAAATLALAGAGMLATVPAQAATYNPAPGYARTCHAFARWQAAGLPSQRQTRTLARDALQLGASLPAQVLYSDVSHLLLSMQAGTNGGNAAARVAHDCHLPS